jgi:hypothetical protein
MLGALTQNMNIQKKKLVEQLIAILLSAIISEKVRAEVDSDVIDYVVRVLICEHLNNR